MFERMKARAARRAGQRAEAEAARIAAALQEALPGDVRIEAEGGEVRIVGRALGRRPALGRDIRWTIAETIR